MENDPVLITGFQRSGTTMMTYVLNRQFPGITNESGILELCVRDYGDRIMRYENIIRNRYQSDFPDVSNLVGRPDVNIIRELYHKLFEKKIPEGKFTQDVNEQKTTILNQKKSIYRDTNVWGDKITNFSDYLKYFRNLFPESKVIYLIRNGITAVASNLRLGWGECGELWERWCGEVEGFLKWRETDRNYLLVKQEDMLSHGSDVYRSVREYMKKEIEIFHFDAFVYKASMAGEGPERKTSGEYGVDIIPKRVLPLLKEFGYV